MNKTYKVAVLKGDGIGPEVTEATSDMANAVATKLKAV